jgi:hypothetical protein
MRYYWLMGARFKTLETLTGIETKTLGYDEKKHQVSKRSKSLEGLKRLKRSYMQHVHGNYRHH